MRKLTKFICLTLCFSLLLSLTAYANGGNGSDDSIDAVYEMQDILLEATDGYFIVVSVPAEKAAEYRQKIESDVLFRKKEIASAIASDKVEQPRSALKITPRALPEGHIEYQKYMYMKDIKEAVDSYSGEGTFNSIIAASNIINKSVVTKLVKAAGKKNVYFLACDLLAIGVKYARAQRLAWWKEAFRDICDKKIKAVRYTIVQNTFEYPKIWRVFERIE